MIAAAGDAIKRFRRLTARTLDPRGGDLMDYFPDTGADQIQRATERTAQDFIVRFFQRTPYGKK